MKVFFAPDYPDKEFYSLAAIFHHLDYLVTESPDDHFDFAMLWQDSTHVEVPPILQEVARYKPVLNLHCTDISKNRVEKAFRSIFGYGSFIDPTAYYGQCIEKTDENARGGALIDCPIASPRDG